MTDYDSELHAFKIQAIVAQAQNPMTDLYLGGPNIQLIQERFLSKPPYEFTPDKPGRTYSEYYFPDVPRD